MLENFSTKKKLLSIVGIGLSGIALTCLMGNYELYASKESLKSAYENRMIPINNLSTISGLLLNDQVLLKTALTEYKPGNPGSESEMSVKALKDLEKSISASDEIWKAFASSKMSSEEKAAANKFAENYAKLLNGVFKPAMVYIQANNINEAIKVSANANDLVIAANQDIDSLIKAKFDMALAEYKETASNFQTNVIISLLIFLAALGMLGYIASNVLGSLKKDLGTDPEELIRTLNRIAAGEIDFRIQLAHGDHDSALAAAKAIKEKLNLLSLDVDILERASVNSPNYARIDLNHHQGDYKNLAMKINSILDATAQLSVTSEAAHDAENNEALKHYVDEVQTIVMAAQNNDLTQRIEVDNKTDEVTILLSNSLNQLLDRIEEIIGNIKDSSETINNATKEISVGNADLSQRTEEQAASLEETASSMEELAATVKLNAENAKQANLSAITASEVAQRGGQAIRDVVATMVDINSSASKIEDIVSVIDGIAFQTNILALNAAVEAARAGEQGRGFAVVAAEVRNLAQRSASAAKEIKGLIGASAKNTAQGYAQIEKAGETMEEIVASTQRVSDIIAEITAASLEQSSGIDQVNNAVGHMDRATQQNAALVEQAAAAAESLMEQSNMLAQSVSKFTVRGDENRSTRETVKPSYRVESAPQRESKPLMSAQARIPNDDPDWKLF